MGIKKIAKLTGLVLGVSMPITLPLTHLGAYLDTKERLFRYEKQEREILPPSKERSFTGFPWDQIHWLYFGYCEEIAYRNFIQNKNNSLNKLEIE